MLVIPAICLKQGKCIRLHPANPEEITVYSDDPYTMAAGWIEQGARRLHLIDIDAALSGSNAQPDHAEIISSLSRDFPDVPLQVGGGVRSLESIERYLDAGARNVIVATKAIEEPEFIGQACAKFPGRLMLALDAVNGMAAVHGRSLVTDVAVKALAMLFESDPLEALIYTDVGRDGMLAGPNLRVAKSLSDSTNTSILVSGGVNGIKDIEDILALGELVSGGVTGVIVGRALAEGALDLQQAQALCDAER